MKWIPLLVIFHVSCFAPYADAACDSNTQFTCCGGDIECVDISRQKDGRFDCTDGSDESPSIDESKTDRGCCDRPNAFHCLSGTCVPPTSILDGYNDCNNEGDSLADDEHKYVGSKCEMSLDTNLCCPCDIYIANSECVNKTGDYLCYCKSGYMSDDLGMTCTKRKFGDPCDVDPDCYDAVDNTVCPSDTKLCNCRNGWYVVNNEYCVRRIITDSCTKDLDCSPAVANSNCTNNVCLCNTGYIVSADKTSCNRRVIGDSCTVNTDCSDAMPNSLCDGGFCACDFKYTKMDDNTGCVSIKIADTCLSTPSDECSAQIENSECKEGQCHCSIGYRPSTDNTTCIRVLLGDHCISDDVCTILDSECSRALCQCSKGYKASSDYKTCYQIILGSESCSVDEDCDLYVGHSECVGNVCTCQIGYFRDLGNTRCTELELGKGICYRDSACATSIPNSVCADGQCTCKEGYFQFTAAQCNKRDIGSYCLADDVCVEGINNTFCNKDENQCQCSSGYSPDDYYMRCVETVVGEKCGADAACTIKVAHSECASGGCRCLPGYVVSTDRRTCTARRLGDRCNTDNDCSSVMSQTECIRGRCSCLDGYRPTSANTSCSKIPVGELPCSSNDDCTKIEAGSLCSENGVCTCDVPNGFYTTPDGLYCKLYKNGEARCVANTTCMEHDLQARCIDGICDCVLGFYPRKPEMVCSISKTRVIPCTSDVHCTSYMPGTECTSGLCRCACGHYETRNGYECTKISLGESCSVLPLVDNMTADCGCAIRNASCQNGDCTCLPGYVAGGNYICLPAASIIGNGCSNIIKDCPWIVAIAVIAAVAALGVIVGVGVYLYKKYQSSHTARTIGPRTAYGTNAVNVRPNTPGNKYPEEVLDGLVKKDSNIFTPQNQHQHLMYRQLE